MSTSKALSAVIAETNPVAPGSCRACQRMGLPILPLREAYAPAIGQTGKKRFNGPGELAGVTLLEKQKRVLREGYVYVLLDRKVWQAYEVTAEGHLRQFNPYETPRATPAPLTRQCVGENHDIPASFLNIDTTLYSTAWLAFASDPWTPTVLDNYKSGKAPAARFIALDLKAARENPGSVGLAITEQNLQVDKAVLEYAEAKRGDFNTVHDFYSRKTRLEALRGYVRVMTGCERMPKGILGLTLPDPMGLVQEHNHQRNLWQASMQAWASNPVNSYPLYTSQCLLRLRELCKDQANEDVPSFVAVSGDGPPVFQDPEKERADVVADKTASLLSRLEKRYDEERRSKWQKAYEATAKHYQQLIDQEAGAYATSIKAEAFKRIDQYDYDSKQARSCASYVATMALCLRGGITDAKPEPKSDGSMPPSTGVTAMLWKSWITDPQSVVYKTLLARNDSLLTPYAGLIPGKDDNGDFSWGDSEKIYTPVTKIIASPDWGEELILPKVKGAIADVLAAYNGAVERLEKDVSKGIRPAATRLNSTALALYSRIWVTQLTVQITLRDYYQLLCDTTRQAQTEVANAIAKATGRAVPTEKQVRSVLMGGLLSLAVADPKLADRMVEVTLWVDSKARDIRNGLGNAVNHVTDVAKGKVAGSVSELKVLAGTLEPEARELLKGIMPSSEQVKNLTSRGLRGIGRSITSFELLASVGGTFLLAQGLRSTLDKLGNALGPQRNEAWMAVYSSSVGVVGGSIEGIGIGLKTVTGLADKSAEAGLGSALARDVFAMGKGVARFGAVMGAAAGLFDAAQAGMAAMQASCAGDARARNAYIGSGFLSLVGTGVLIYAAYFELSLISGPVGIAILLGLTAYAITQWGASEESTPIERWARRCYFGKGGENPPIVWTSSKDANTAVAALNAAVLGIDATLDFRMGVQTSSASASSGSASISGGAAALTYVPMLAYRLVFPRYTEAGSAYRWRLLARRWNDAKAGGSQELASGHHNVDTPNTANGRPPPKHLDYDPKTVTPKVTISNARTSQGQAVQVLTIEGTIELGYRATSDEHDIDGATLEFSYWPDRTAKNALAALSQTENHR
ncbi:T6SS effector BTH_I2691 family protein [Paraburkholderia tropica]|uniref:T6SS effector BTH_I2691 family protein n=1 Tax=Paraburkholderia tropica TaxID=92647 RepID=UPI002AB031BF|nr:T6SS effector BTH_I2691 family protein [Paraburkholderia tropica]